MGSTQFGDFFYFCANGTLPICNIFNESPVKGGSGFGSGPGSCQLTGIPIHGGTEYIRNLGSIILAFIAILTTLFLLARSEQKRAAVGRREIQLFLIGYIIVEICEIFTVGGFPLPTKVRLGFTAVHLAAIAATSWILLMNGLVGFQLIDDGTPMSIGLIVASAAAIFVGTGYITLDTAFSFTGHFDSSLTADTFNRNIALYVLYQLLPLLCVVLFLVLETYLVLVVLGEKRPMMYLVAAFVLFAIAQVFQYAVSIYICRGTDGKINGALFETLFTLLAVVMTWVFWSSITEDDWPMPAPGEAYT